MFRWPENAGEVKTSRDWPAGTIAMLAFEVGLSDQDSTVPKCVCHAGESTANRPFAAYQKHAGQII